MLIRINEKMKEKGFTLIELMIVVAIIGILAAIAIPNFRNYQLKTKRGELPTNLKAIKTAEVAYQAENDTFQTLSASPRTTPNATKAGWTDNGGFNTIGWQPSGNVYGVYSGAGTTIASDITGKALCDVDADGATANYTFFVNISNPSNDYDVRLDTAANVF